MYNYVLRYAEAKSLGERVNTSRVTISEYILPPLLLLVGRGEGGEAFAPAWRFQYKQDNL